MVGRVRKVICRGVERSEKKSEREHSGRYALTNPIPSYPPTDKMGRD
jgi:hypothetical protein